MQKRSGSKTKEHKYRHSIRAKVQKPIAIRIGTRQGAQKLVVREGEDKQMKKHILSSLGLQETIAKQTRSETRKAYTWFFRQRRRKKRIHSRRRHNCTHQPRAIHSRHKPIDSRLMYVTLGSTMPTTIIAYMAPSNRPYEDKTKASEDLQNHRPEEKQVRCSD